MIAAGALLELVSGDALLVVIPAGAVLALVGILAYVVKKKDRQRERIARAHNGPRGDANPPEGR